MPMDKHAFKKMVRDLPVTHKEVSEAALDDLARSLQTGLSVSLSFRFSLCLCFCVYLCSLLLLSPSLVSQSVSDF